MPATFGRCLHVAGQVHNAAFKNCHSLGLGELHSPLPLSSSQSHLHNSKIK
jgi:hypothetical protein